MPYIRLLRVIRMRRAFTAGIIRGHIMAAGIVVGRPGQATAAAITGERRIITAVRRITTGEGPVVTTGADNLMYLLPADPAGSFIFAIR